MKAFSALFAQLDGTTSSNAKLEAMRVYFSQAPAADAAWAVYLLAGGKPRQLVPTRLLREIAAQAAGIPTWLFEESYDSVGDLAETISVLLPDADGDTDEGLAVWIEQKLLPLRGQPPELLPSMLEVLWRQLDLRGRFLCFKIITGSLRVGVSRLLVTRALASVADLDPKQVAQRMIGYTDLKATPDAAAFAALIAPESEAANDPARSGHPYPFFLAHPLQVATDTLQGLLGPPADWVVEWKWDGIRAQLVRRGDDAWVWSRGEELVTERFPELADMGRTLPTGTVLDGEILVMRDGQIQPFSQLQRRLGRKVLSNRILQEFPVVLRAYDLLEWQGEDWRTRPLAERREQLEHVVADAAHPALALSPTLQAETWEGLDEQRAQSRALGVEGMMLKARQAPYGVGRTKDVGTWWKWKVDPFTVDAVLIYAQPGHGRRASLYTDYTFALWDAPPGSPERKLVPFAKAYSGLTDAEIKKVDSHLRKTVVEKFGPVISVKPLLVFELGFEGIDRSTRHKSGIAVRFPRMLRWRQDKPVDEADTLESLAALLPEAVAG
ncbi:ATP-dependent DNA ligase [Pigmentiphaga aceris]|uniref:DNA ligase (ATP) n=1 Tax=Pigmentiphaga aceris TaxID=1940612 RepID=A0A5C0B2Q8_9BURK|nr:ATP-dependent DNA ligase [Pigmentiphaga aceris]QEI08003.1 ATP-dependent DNA ligase [Pigmentiphaga aceris]